jgi:putative intracellular protease/amidase
LDDAAEVVGQAAVGEGHEAVLLEHDDAGAVVHATARAAEAPPATPPTMRILGEVFIGLLGEMRADAAEDRQATCVGHAVARDAAGALGGDQAVGAEAHEVLADRGLRTAQPGGELRDVQRALLEDLHDAEAVRVRQRPQGSGAVAEDLGVERTRL